MLIRIIAVQLILSVCAFGQSHLEQIIGPFERPQDVTAACLGCHEEAAKEVMQTAHWTWSGDSAIDQAQQMIKIGKINIINNFCIAVPSNYPRCTSCHVGYGWADAQFDFSKEGRMDWQALGYADDPMKTKKSAP